MFGQGSGISSCAQSQRSPLKCSGISSSGGSKWHITQVQTTIPKKTPKASENEHLNEELMNQLLFWHIARFFLAFLVFLPPS
jgi:hypothetical protein